MRQKVLLVPGMLSPRALLCPLKRALEADGHEVHLFSSWPTLTVFQYRDLLAQLRTEGPAVVIGHSLGGFITVLAAERRPDLFTAVIGLDPAINGRKVELECPYYEARGVVSRILHVDRADAFRASSWHGTVPLEPGVIKWVRGLLQR